MFGQNIPDFIGDLLSRYEVADGNAKGEKPTLPLFSVGLNCLAEVAQLLPVIERLVRDTKLRISLYPNAGKPDGKGGYSKSPKQLQADVWPLLENHLLNVVGGCCGTTDEHIRKIAELVQPADGIYLSPRSEHVKPQAFTLAKADTPKVAKTDNSPNTSDSPAKRLYNAILAGKGTDAAAATKDAIDAGLEPQELINGSMIKAMGEVGQRFQDGKAFVPQLLMAGRAMKAALELLQPMMKGAQSMALGKVLIGTVKGDLHDIGKNLVASMLEGCGFEVVNIGIDVSAETFIEEIKKNNPDILCMSALLTTTMGYMKDVIDALQAAGMRDQVKIMVGGAPVSQAFADEIGADGYSDNANTAVAVAKKLLGIA